MSRSELPTAESMALTWTLTALVAPLGIGAILLLVIADQAILGVVAASAAGVVLWWADRRWRRRNTRQRAARKQCATDPRPEDRM